MKKMMAIVLMIVLLGTAYAVAQYQEETAEAVEVIEVTEASEEAEAMEEDEEVAEILISPARFWRSLRNTSSSATRCSARFR